MAGIKATVLSYFFNLLFLGFLSYYSIAIFFNIWRCFYNELGFVYVTYPPPWDLQHAFCLSCATPLTFSDILIPFFLLTITILSSIIISIVFLSLLSRSNLLSTQRKKIRILLFLTIFIHVYASSAFFLNKGYKLVAYSHEFPNYAFRFNLIDYGILTTFSVLYLLYQTVLHNISMQNVLLLMRKQVPLLLGIQNLLLIFHNTYYGMALGDVFGSPYSLTLNMHLFPYIFSFATQVLLLQLALDSVLLFFKESLIITETVSPSFVFIDFIGIGIIVVFVIHIIHRYQLLLVNPHLNEINGVVNPFVFNEALANAPSSSIHSLGCDSIGRDILGLFEFNYAIIFYIALQISVLVIIYAIFIHIILSIFPPQIYDTTIDLLTNIPRLLVLFFAQYALKIAYHYVYTAGSPHLTFFTDSYYIAFLLLPITYVGSALNFLQQRHLSIWQRLLDAFSTVIRIVFVELSFVGFFIFSFDYGPIYYQFTTATLFLPIIILVIFFITLFPNFFKITQTRVEIFYRLK